MATQDERDLARKRAQSRINARQSIVIQADAKPSQAGAFGRGALRGLTFNFGDEVASVLSGIKAYGGSFLEDSRNLKSGGDVGGPQDRFGAAKDAFEVSQLESRANLLDDRAEFPKTAFTGELLGGGVSGLGGLKALGQINRVSKLPLALRVPLVGGLESGLHGAGAADSGNRLAGAGFGAVTGAIATPLLAGVGVTAMQVLRPFAKRLGEGLLGTPKDRAIREITRALDADDINPAEAQTLLRTMGVNSTLADLGDTLTRLGRTVTSEAGPAASKVKRFLDARQRMGQIQLRQVARRATGSNDFDKGIIEIINGAESKAGPIYDEVFSQVLDLTPVMSSLLKRPAMVAARRKAATILKNEGFSDDFVNDVTDVRYMDAVKRAIGDQEAALIRVGKNNEARVLGELRRDFVSEIDAQVPRYAEARSIFAGEQAMKDAADVGRNMFIGKKDVTDIAEQIAKMGESELTAARMGFLKWLSTELSNQSINKNTIANKFSDVPKFKQLLQTLFPSRGAVDDFIDTAAAQRTFAQTRNTVTGGSPTARIQADANALNPGLLRVASDAAFSQLNGITSALRLISGNTKLTPDVLEEMGKILFDPKIIPTQALKRGIGPRLFEIPTASPGATAAISGGLIGSQQDDILEGLRSAGLLGP